MNVRILPALLLCGMTACGGAASHAGNDASSVLAISPLRATGTMHVAIAAPQAITADLTAARCYADSPGNGRGGLRIVAHGEGSVHRAFVIDRRIAGEGDDTWFADSAHAMRAPLRAEVSLSNGIIVTGGSGSTTSVHSADGGKTGTLTFAHATFGGTTGALDASGTISWSCSS